MASSNPSNWWVLNITMARWLQILTLFTLLLSGKFIQAQSPSVEKLRIQTSFSKNSPLGKYMEKLINDFKGITSMNIRMHYDSELSLEALEATRNGILDCFIDRVSSHSHLDPGFELAGNFIGGYNNPINYLSWFYDSGGKDVVQKELFDSLDLNLIGFFTLSGEILISNTSITSVSDFKDLKFQSGSDLENEILEHLGAIPVNISPSDIDLALRTGRLDGLSIPSTDIHSQFFKDLREISFTNYPGIRLAPAYHLSCQKEIWNKLEESERRSLLVTFKNMANQIALDGLVDKLTIPFKLEDRGLEVQAWSKEKSHEFRQKTTHFILSHWANKSSASLKILESHMEYIIKSRKKPEEEVPFSDL